MSDYYALERNGAVSIIAGGKIVCLDVPTKIAVELLKGATGENRLEYCSPEVWLLEFFKVLASLAPEPLAKIVDQERHRVRMELQLMCNEILPVAKPDNNFDGFRGEWQRGDVYFSGDTVSLNGSIWLCTKRATAKPGPNNSHWSPISQRATALTV